jgi:hypothetical protein
VRQNGYQPAAWESERLQSGVSDEWRAAHCLFEQQLDLTLAAQAVGFVQWNRTAAGGVLACELSLI